MYSAPQIRRQKTNIQRHSDESTERDEELREVADSRGLYLVVVDRPADDGNDDCGEDEWPAFVQLAAHERGGECADYADDPDGNGHYLRAA